MTTAIVDRPSPGRERPRPLGLKPLRRSAPTRGPLARPIRPAPLPSPGLANPAAVRSCRVDLVTPPPAPWRLTERGIALVMVLTAMIVVAAVTVIGLTAWRVTSPGYQATSTAQLSQR